MGLSVGICRQGVRASVGPNVSADVVAGFKKAFKARGRANIKVYDGERVLGQRVLLYVLDRETNGSFVFCC